MSDIYQDVGRRIRALRLRQELTIEDLSDLSGLHASYIGQIERGVKKSSLKTVESLAGALGVPTAGLFDGAPQAKSLPRLDEAARACTPREQRLLLEAVKLLSKGLRGLRS